jgi:leucyl aminopeptidase (aminopeptidase T)
MLEEADSYIFTLGPRHPIDWRGIPPERRSLATVWLLENNSFVKEWKSIAAKRGTKMLGIEATRATKEWAKALDIDFTNYARSMYDGCLADSQTMANQARRLSPVLSKKSAVRITTRTGTDLRFKLDERPVEVSHGLVTDEEAENGRVVFLPSGAVGTTVDEESAEGVISYDQPILSWKGRIEGLKIRVKGGRVTEYAASRGVGIFEEYLDSNGPDANRFAFFGLGLNPMLKRGYTQDDKVLGSTELNFGENESRGGKNRGGRNFWGTVSDADVTVGVRTIAKSGKLVI